MTMLKWLDREWARTEGTEVGRLHVETCIFERIHVATFEALDQSDNLLISWKIIEISESGSVVE